MTLSVPAAPSPPGATVPWLVSVALPRASVPVPSIKPVAALVTALLTVSVAPLPMWRAPLLPPLGPPSRLTLELPGPTLTVPALDRPPVMSALPSASVAPAALVRPPLATTLSTSVSVPWLVRGALMMAPCSTSIAPVFVAVLACTAVSSALPRNTTWPAPPNVTLPLA